MVEEHFYVKFGDPSCSRIFFEIACGNTDRQTNKRQQQKQQLTAQYSTAEKTQLMKMILMTVVIATAVKSAELSVAFHRLTPRRSYTAMQLSPQIGSRGLTAGCPEISVYTETMT